MIQLPDFLAHQVNDLLRDRAEAEARDGARHYIENRKGPSTGDLSMAEIFAPADDQPTAAELYEGCRERWLAMEAAREAIWPGTPLAHPPGLSLEQQWANLISIRTGMPVAEQTL